MKNKAKCKLCNDIIESHHDKDHVICSCGEIAVDGGESMRCSAKDFSNFLRVDDEGNEIVVEVKEKYNREYYLEMLMEFLKKIEEMPPNALYTSANQYDLYTLGSLICAILKSKD